MSVSQMVGEQVFLLMFRAGITQVALAERTGMSQSSLSRKLHGATWTVDELDLVAGALGVPMPVLLGWDVPDDDPGGHASGQYRASRPRDLGHLQAA